MIQLNDKTSLNSIINYVAEQREILLKTWLCEHDDFERVIRLAIQGVESTKNHYAQLNVSKQYWLGKLDGYTELLEQLFRIENKVKELYNELI